MTHQWRFFRSGGFDQVRLDRIEDWQQLATLDPKLWAALSCPVKGLEFDERTLQYLDTDQDGRVRIDEVKAAVSWVLSVLQKPQVLLDSDQLPLDAIDSSSEEGRKLAASARRLLQNIGKADASTLSVADTADLATIFPPDQLNGDGIITQALAASRSETLQALVAAVQSCGLEAQDRSGDSGIGQQQLDQFVEEGQARLDWLAGEAAVSQLLGADTATIFQLVSELHPKVEDFFTRCQLAAYDENAIVALNGSAEDYQQLSRQLLSGEGADVSHLPLARVNPAGLLSLTEGIHPSWAGRLAQLATLATGYFGGKPQIRYRDWQQLVGALEPYAQWQQAEPASAVATLETELLQACLGSDTVAAAQALISEDLAQQAEAEAVLDVDKLVRYQRYLRDLLRNFVSFENFYSLQQPAIFQNGRLYLDGRSCDLCLEVNDAGKHAKLAALSGTYLLYLDCVRQASGEKKTVVAAMTAGDAGNLMAGRNGVFYDRDGTDWDATVSSIVQNPISIREAFFTPYQRVGRMLSEQVQKFAAAKDKEIETKSAAGVGDAAKLAETTTKPATPAPFDVAKFAGIFAAIGLAIGAIGTALAAVVTGFLGLLWWQMPLALLGSVLFISGPSMLIAWFKLRTRNLAPLLDANGWAVNTNAKLSIPFGARLTALPTIPAGASRSFKDPYEPKSQFGSFVLLVIVLGLAALAWQLGWLSRWFQ